MKGNSCRLNTFVGITESLTMDVNRKYGWTFRSRTTWPRKNPGIHPHSPTKSADRTSARGETRRMRPSRDTGSPLTATNKPKSHKRPYLKPSSPFPPSLSSAQDAREARTVHDGPSAAEQKDHGKTFSKNTAPSPPIVQEHQSLPET